MAFRVAAIVKVPDPWGWIDENEDLVRHWIYHFNRTGWPDRNTAILANEIYQLGCLFAASKGHTMPERTPSDWMPAESADKASGKRTMTIDEQVRWASRRARLKA